MSLAAGSLTTARLALTPLRAADADPMVQVLGDPELYRFTGGRPPTRAELQERYARQAGGRSPDGRAQWCNWIVRLASGVPIGVVQATVVADTAELAWVITPAQQRRGYAVEAAGAVAQWLNSAGVKHLIAHIHPEHAASAAVARALGLAPTDTVHEGEVRWRWTAQPGCMPPSSGSTCPVR